MHVGKQPVSEERTQGLQWKVLALTQGRCYPHQPDRKLLDHRMLGRVLRAVMPQYGGTINPGLSTAPGLPNKSYTQDLKGSNC